MKRRRRKDLVTIECPVCHGLNAVPRDPPGIPECGNCEADLPWGPKRKILRRLPKSDRFSFWIILFSVTAGVLSWIDLEHGIFSGYISRIWSRFLSSTAEWITSVAVSLTIISLISLAWLILAMAMKVGWSEWRAARAQPKQEKEEPYLDIGAWEAVSDYVALIREKKEQVRQWAAREQDPDLQMRAFDLLDEYQRQEEETLAMASQNITN
jgi:hypothetical protein